MIVLFGKMLLIQLILFISFKAHTKELFINNLESIDLDVSDQTPMDVVRFVIREGCEINDVLYPNRGTYKIGNVFDNKKLIYSDSDILIYRRVETRITMLEPAKTIMIFSVYRTNKGDLREIVEFTRKFGETDYKELIRIPVELNLQIGSIVNDKILMFLDNSTSSLNFDITLPFRDKYMIGKVKMGKIVIDPYVNKVIYKGISTYRDPIGNIYVEINSATKEGFYIFTKYVIKPEKEGEECVCEVLEKKINQFV